MRCRNPRPLGVVRDIWLGLARSYKIAVAKQEIGQEGRPLWGGLAKFSDFTIMWYAGNGCSRIFGNLDIYLGDNVTIFDNSSFTGLKVFDDPKLEIGNNTYIGPLARFMVAKNIKIGSFTIVTSSFIADNSAHSVSNAFARMASGYGGPSLKGIKPVVIGDLCWLAAGSRIYPGAQIGDGVVAKLDTHVKGMIPSFCLIEGNPCKIVGKLPIPEELKEHFGEDRYRLWKEQQGAVKLD